MTHDEIASQNIAERYLLGKLSAHDCTRFEEHFVDCPNCLDRLESTERFQAALKPLGSEILCSPSARVGPWGWPRSAWLVAAALVLVIGLSVVLAVRGLNIQRELERTKIASLGWQRRYERERAAPATPPLPGRAVEAAALGPLVAPTFYLNITRGGDSETSAPANRVTVASDTNWVALSTEGELEQGFQSLRASLRDLAGNDIWQKTGLSATPHQAFSVILPASMLKSGNYILTLEGLSSTGHYSVVGRYRFRVVAP